MYCLWILITRYYGHNQIIVRYVIEICLKFWNANWWLGKYDLRQFNAWSSMKCIWIMWTVADGLVEQSGLITNTQSLDSGMKIYTLKLNWKMDKSCEQNNMLKFLFTAFDIKIFTGTSKTFCRIRALDWNYFFCVWLFRRSSGHWRQTGGRIIWDLSWRHSWRKIWTNCR